MTSASSTCGWTIRVSTIHRRAVSLSAVCRSWSAWGSPRLQGRANEIGLKAELVLRDLGRGAAPGLYRTRSGSWYRRLGD
jgi:hypothetical protein